MGTTRNALTRPDTSSRPNTLRRFTAVASLGLLAAATVALLWSPDVARASASRCESKPYVVKIHADWCASCKASEATWARVESDLGGQATVVTLDVTDRVAFQESKLEAERLGISEFFQEFRSKTGTIAVLDCRTREPVAKLTGERSLARYREAITKASGPR
jgi:thiol-disulfide isomerase/thioredoxin